MTLVERTNWFRQLMHHSRLHREITGFHPAQVNGNTERTSSRGVARTASTLPSPIQQRMEKIRQLAAINNDVIIENGKITADPYKSLDDIKGKPVTCIDMKTGRVLASREIYDGPDVIGSHVFLAGEIRKTFHDHDGIVIRVHTTPLQRKNYIASKEEPEIYFDPDEPENINIDKACALASESKDKNVFEVKSSKKQRPYVGEYIGFSTAHYKYTDYVVLWFCDGNCLEVTNDSRVEYPGRLTLIPQVKRQIDTRRNTERPQHKEHFDETKPGFHSRWWEEMHGARTETANPSTGFDQTTTRNAGLQARLESLITKTDIVCNPNKPIPLEERRIYAALYRDTGEIAMLSGRYEDIASGDYLFSRRGKSEDDREDFPITSSRGLIIRKKDRSNIDLINEARLMPAPGLSTTSFLEDLSNNRLLADELSNGFVYEIHVPGINPFRGTYQGCHETPTGKIILWFYEGYFLTAKRGTSLTKLVPDESGRSLSRLRLGSLDGAPRTQQPRSPLVAARGVRNTGTTPADIGERTLPSDLLLTVSKKDFTSASTVFVDLDRIKGKELYVTQNGITRRGKYDGYNFAPPFLYVKIGGETEEFYLKSGPVTFSSKRIESDVSGIVTGLESTQTLANQP